MLSPRLETKPTKIRVLLEDYKSGRIVVPEFQRGYVWKKNKAPILLDSLYRQYPISSLLLWDSDDKVDPRSKTPKISRTGDVCWLVDGQQRITTLFKTIEMNEGINVVYNPYEEKFKLENAATKNDSKNWFPVTHIFDDKEYRSIRRGLDEKNDRLEKRFEQVRKILDYEVPVIRMIDHNFDSAVAAFERINTKGSRLKNEDIESAKVASKHRRFISDHVTPYLRDLHSHGYSRLNVMHLFRVCGFIARPDGRSRTQLHELEQKEVLVAWKSTQQATDTAINLIRSELGLSNMDILWSGALLVPIIAICTRTPVRDLNSKSLMAWVALAALYHRYSSSVESALDQDLKECKSNDPIGGLLSNVRGHTHWLGAAEFDFDATSMDKGALLAVYISCLNKDLLDFYTGNKLIGRDDLDKHHILPRSQFSENLRHTSDCVANIAFISGGVNKSISNTGPEVYLDRITDEMRDSQCIPNNRITPPHAVEFQVRITSQVDFQENRRHFLKVLHGR